MMNDELLIAENSRHCVNRFDLDGKPLGKWGKRDRTGIEGFAACCNPVNIDIGPDNVLYTAESGIGRIKNTHPKASTLAWWVTWKRLSTTAEAGLPRRPATFRSRSTWMPAVFT